MTTYDIHQLKPSWIRKINVAQVQDLVPGECWLWTGARSDAGYGRVQVRRRFDYTVRGRSYSVERGVCGYLHRAVYELLVGPISEGLHIDHLCRQPSCCNPAHLEPVTPLENTRRGVKGTQTHCARGGHPLSGDNVYVHVGKKGTHRTCRTCRDANVAEWRAARKERQRQTWSMYLPDQEDVA
jgi:hypothetical protein